jgi:hypothetical protein
MMKVIITLAAIVFIVQEAFTQMIPSRYENVSHLMTFGPGADAKWGDDDHVQVYFFSIPANYRKNFYIKVLDPSTSGDMDQANGGFDTKTQFAVYGGKGAFSNPAARNMNPIKGYDSGVLLDKKVFGSESTYENKWYTFGPFNPKEGELIKAIDKTDKDKYYIKVIIKGISGNDGNGYKLQLCDSESNNIQQAEAFAFEVGFRLKSKKGETAHFYPFIDEGVTNVKQNNFDFDSDGKIRLTSVVKNMHPAETSKDGSWENSIHKIVEEEFETVLDLQIDKSSSSSNDMVIYMENQYGEALPFYSVPSAYQKKYRYKVKVNVK